MLHGSNDDIALTLVRNTIAAIQKRDPAAAQYLAQQLKLSAMSGMGGLLDDFASGLSKLATVAAPFYTSSQQAQQAQDQAKLIAQIEAQKAKTQLAQLQAQSQSMYAAQQLQAQDSQLQQYMAQLKAGTTDKMILVVGLGIAAFAAVAVLAKKRRA